MKERGKAEDCLSRGREMRKRENRERERKKKGRDMIKKE